MSSKTKYQQANERAIERIESLMAAPASTPEERYAKLNKTLHGEIRIRSKLERENLLLKTKLDASQRETTSAYLRLESLRKELGEICRWIVENSDNCGDDTFMLPRLCVDCDCHIFDIIYRNKGNSAWGKHQQPTTTTNANHRT